MDAEQLLVSVIGMLQRFVETLMDVLAQVRQGEQLQRLQQPVLLHQVLIMCKLHQKNRRRRKKGKEAEASAFLVERTRKKRKRR